MKPYRIIISAFGPYAKEIEIPFFQLGQEGLFLITGDTGAGKTTIFDAICFALFGEVSGSNREVDSLRSDFALPETKTFVDMIFLHHEEQYRIVRNPAYSRPKLRSSGMTTQTADAALYYPDGQVLTGYGKTKAAIEELLGLDAKQFKQIAMIAQGEFLKMLYADSNTRGQIFRKLFQTDCYADFQKRLKELEKEKRMAFQESGKRLETYLEQLGFENNLALAKEFLEEGKVHLKTEEYNLAQQKKQLVNLEQKIQERIALCAQARTEQIQMKNRQEAEKNLVSLEAEREEREKMREFLDRQRKALDYILPFEEAWKGEKEEVSLLMEEQQNLEKQYKEVEAYLHQAENVQQEIIKKKEILEQKKTIFAAKTEKQEQFQKKSAILSDLKQCEQVKLRLTQEKEDLENALKKSETICKQSHEVGEKLTEIEKNIILWKQQGNTLEERHDVLMKLLENQKEISQMQQDLAKKRIAYKKQEEQWSSAAKAALEAERLFLREQAGFLAEMLEENMPCPVCGSRVHPAKAIPSTSAPTQEEWKNFQKQADSEKEKLNQLRTEGIEKKERLSYLQEDLKKSINQLRLPSLDVLQNEIEKNKEETVLWEKQGEALQKEKQYVFRVIETGKQEEKRMEKQHFMFQSVLENLQEQEREYSCLEGQFIALKEQIGQQTYEQLQEELKQLHDEITIESAYIAEEEKRYAQAQTQWERIHAILKKNKEIQKERMEKETQAAISFQRQLTAYGFDDAQKYYEILPKRENLEIAEAENRAYFLALSKAESRVEYMKKETAQFLEVDIEQVTEEISLLKQEKETAQADYEERWAAYTMQQDILLHGWEEWKVYTKEKDCYYPIKELSDTASGDINGMDRIPFEQFIQGVYFERVVQEANLRFQDMTDGRYLLMRAEEAADKRVQSGLALEVMDYFTGKRRSIKSLSGGEAFKASLCLALGLSDMIQQRSGGIQVDAMFIDEGFGSLDEQSREQAVAVLQNLSVESRLIGIISHVTELKDNIEKKIIVKKGIYGSHISICCS